MDDPIIKPVEHMAFPQSRIDAIEQSQRNTQPYKSPHHPDPTKRGPGATPGRPVVGADMQSNFTIPESYPKDLQPTAQERPTVPVPMSAPMPQGQPVVPPGFTTPTSEEEAVAVDLPSNYAFYDFKALYVKPFKGRHMAKLSRAREEGSTLFTVEAVSAVLSTPEGHQHLAFKLTVPDFYYMLYWLRLNSFTKTSFIHNSTCTNPVHVEQVSKGEVAADTLKHSEIITRATLKETKLLTIPNIEDFALDYPGVVVKVCTMQDALEMTEDPDFVDEEFRYAAEVACYLDMNVDNGDGTYRKANLKERIEVVNDMSPDDINIVKAYERAISDYGIVESVEVTCRHCKDRRIDPIVLQAHSFFQ